MLMVPLAIVGGTLLGLAIAYFGARKIALSRWMLPTEYKFTKVGRRISWIITVITLPFVWFLAFVMGGNFGGGLAGSLAEATGLPERFLVPLGIGTGIALCIALLLIGIAMIGFLVVRTIELFVLR